MKTQEGNRDYTKIIEIAAKFGFKQDPKVSNVFIKKGSYFDYMVDLSASGDSEFAIAKNIIDQTIDRADNDFFDTRYNATFKD